MARFQKTSPESTRQNAAVAPARKPKRKQGKTIEDTMFFPRLRSHAKWMFVVLALFFGLGFVVFGVGAGGIGIGDIIRDGGGGSGSQSVKSARKETEKHPESLKAWRDLATALQTDGNIDEAVGALQTATALKGAGADVYRELAGLYLAQAGAKQREAQNIQLDAAFAGATQNFPGTFTVKDKAVFEDPLGKAINASAAQRASAVLAEAQGAAAQAVDAYRSVVRLTPNDPNVLLELATAAERAGDATAAIEAYEKFLKLAPDDTSAPIVKAQLKQLKQQYGGGTG
ncbi:MAG: tetratricopeptide repeat protein [Gaiellales bacterium]